MLKTWIKFLFLKKPECLHEKITPTSIGNYCPDCGKEIIITWIILRCKCCAVKREANLYLKSVSPMQKYCTKCGSHKYYIEKTNKLEFYDLSYAVLLKEEIQENLIKNKTQIWIEENSWSNLISPKLIPSLSK